jgi:hypothetical protein
MSSRIFRSSHSLPTNGIPAIGRETVRQETDAPAKERPEGPVGPRSGQEVDEVQDDIHNHEERKMEVERPDLADTATCTPVAFLIIG